MQVILLEKVHKLGVLGDTVKVKPGFARNYLIPYGKAVFATQQNISLFETKRQALEQKEAERLAKAKARAEAFAELRLQIYAKAGDEGKLFGSLGTKDIASALTQAGQETSKSEVRLPEGPIRHIGEHTITLHLHTDVDISVTVVVNSEN